MNMKKVTIFSNWIKATQLEKEEKKKILYLYKRRWQQNEALKWDAIEFSCKIWTVSTFSLSDYWYKSKILTKLARVKEQNV